MDLIRDDEVLKYTVNNERYSTDSNYYGLSKDDNYRVRYIDIYSTAIYFTYLRYYHFGSKDYLKLNI